jgi:hypothetical protein
MKVWDVLLSSVPAGYAGRLDELADLLGERLDEDSTVIDSTISGDLESGQLDVHFELRSVETPLAAATQAIEAVTRALAQCGADAPGGTAQLAEISSSVVGLEIHAMPVPARPDSRPLVPA